MDVVFFEPKKFTDVRDRAIGNCEDTSCLEPWRGFRWDEIRVVKEIYPPRLQLAFWLTDASGEIVKEGGRDLRGLSLMTRGFADDTLRHEKAVLDDWLRSEFARPRSP